jgi:hypothetical protein
MRRSNACISDREIAYTKVSSEEIITSVINSLLAKLDYPQLSVRITNNRFRRCTEIEIEDSENYGFKEYREEEEVYYRI